MMRLSHRYKACALSASVPRQQKCSAPGGEQPALARSDFLHVLKKIYCHFISELLEEHKAKPSSL